jgi:hypothetical protein
MKSLWNVVSFLAVVHLLALVIIVLWLWQSHRLDGARLADIRQLLSAPVHEAREGMLQNLRAAEELRLREMEELLKGNPPRDSATQIQHAALVAMQEDQARRRLADEKGMMLEQLAIQTAEIDEIRADFERERQAWEAAVRTDRTRQADEQFMQAVKQYEQTTPKQGKRLLQELITQGHIDQAVAYLDAMNPRSASKILKEFKTDDEIRLATELLERLRTLGSAPNGSASAKESRNAVGPDNSDQPAAGSNGPA